MDIYGLIGFPLEHSFSKKYFNSKFQEEAIIASYELFPLKSIGELPGLLKTPDLKGINVTIPYKRAVLQYLDDISHIPVGLNACNCIKINNGKTLGYNTDVTGFEKSLFPLLKDYHNRALILGSGGAAEAARYIFDKHGIEYKTVGRVIKPGTDLLYEQLNDAIISEHRLIVNTTPLGMHPSEDGFPAFPYHALGSRHFLFDLVYNPPKTLFLQKGEERGATILNGYEMLKIQADESWKIWSTG